MKLITGLAGLLLGLLLAFGGVPEAYARGGGGGGGGHGFGGSFGGSGMHMGSFGMGSSHGSSFGGSFHGFAGASHSFSAPSFSRGTISPSFHGYAGSIHPGTTFQSPMTRSFNNPNFGTRSYFGSGAVTRGSIGGLTNNHPVNPQNWQHNGNAWGGNAWRGNQFASRGFDHDRYDHGRYDHDFDHHHFYGGYGFYDPLLWGWGPYYSGYGYGYPDYGYAYDYSPYDSYYDYGYGTPAVAAVPAYTSAYAAPVTGDVAGTDEAASQGDWGNQFMDSARQAFLQHDYADALRLAKHASIEEPRDAKAHELMSLALFALKDYRGANLEAHAALAAAPAAEWPTLYAYYGDLPTYQQQLNALVAYINAHPDAADARFVLAYHDLMLGGKDAAKVQLGFVLSKVPQDQVAVKLFKELGGTPPPGAVNSAPAPIPSPANP